VLGIDGGVDRTQARNFIFHITHLGGDPVFELVHGGVDIPARFQAVMETRKIRALRLSHLGNIQSLQRWVPDSLAESSHTFR
jgi:hypothetical protein